MPEYELRDNLDRLPKVIYFTDSFLALHIDRKGNASIAYAIVCSENYPSILLFY